MHCKFRDFLESTHCVIFNLLLFPLGSFIPGLTQSFWGFFSFWVSCLGFLYCPNRWFPPFSATSVSVIGFPICLQAQTYSPFGISSVPPHYLPAGFWLTLAALPSLLFASLQSPATSNSSSLALRKEGITVCRSSPDPRWYFPECLHVFLMIQFPFPSLHRKSHSSLGTPTLWISSPLATPDARCKVIWICPLCFGCATGWCVW